MVTSSGDTAHRLARQDVHTARDTLVVSASVTQSTFAAKAPGHHGTLGCRDTHVTPHTPRHHTTPRTRQANAVTIAQRQCMEAVQRLCTGGDEELVFALENQLTPEVVAPRIDVVVD